MFFRWVFVGCGGCFAGNGGEGMVVLGWCVEEVREMKRDVLVGLIEGCGSNLGKIKSKWVKSMRLRHVALH